MRKYSMEKISDFQTLSNLVLKEREKLLELEKLSEQIKVSQLKKFKLKRVLKNLNKRINKTNESIIDKLNANKNKIENI